MRIGIFLSNTKTNKQTKKVLPLYEQTEEGKKPKRSTKMFLQSTHEINNKIQCKIVMVGKARYLKNN